MTIKSNIEWTDSTFNPWEGCTKVGPGCDNCYAEGRNARFGGGAALNWGPGAPRRRTSAHNWNEPRRWNAKADAFLAEHGRRQRVFCASLADVFDNEVESGWRDELFALIAETPRLDWLLLTKRIGNVRKMVPPTWLLPNLWPAHLWLGATIVNQTEADRDIPKLLQVPASVRFLSMEPLLGAVSIWRHLLPHCGRHPGVLDPDGKCAVCESRGIWGIGGDELTEAEKAPILPGLSWVIVGGESGPGARPMHPDWARGVRNQCEMAGVPMLFKQWGEWVPRGPEGWGYPIVDGMPRVRLTDAGENGSDLGADGDNHVWMNRAGKKAAGRLLDGRTWDGVPTP